MPHRIGEESDNLLEVSSNVWANGHVLYQCCNLFPASATNLLNLILWQFRDTKETKETKKSHEAHRIFMAGNESQKTQKAKETQVYEFIYFHNANNS
jgi:hypothetical protein